MIQWINTETSLLEQLELENGCWYNIVIVWEDDNHCSVGLTKMSPNSTDNKKEIE